VGDAFRRGALTAEQASLIAGIAEEKTVDEWIAWAKKVPVLALRAEASRIRRLVELDETLPWKARLVPEYGCALHERPGTGIDGYEKVSSKETDVPSGGVRMCAAGEKAGCASVPGTAHAASTASPGGFAFTGTIRLSFSLSRELKALWDEAFSRFLALSGAAGAPAPGALAGDMPGIDMQNVTALFLEALLDHFLDTWLTVTKKERHHRILHRDGFRCMIPGCSSRRNLQVHHIVFRSHGGGDEDQNLLCLCLAHHLHGVHDGHITIEGEAPDRLTIALGVERGKDPFALWRHGERLVPGP